AVEGAEGGVLLVGLGPAPAGGPDLATRQADPPVEVALPERLGGRQVAGLQRAEPAGNRALVARHRRPSAARPLAPSHLADRPALIVPRAGGWSYWRGSSGKQRCVAHSPAGRRSWECDPEPRGGGCARIVRDG